MERGEQRKILNSRYHSCRAFFQVMVIAGFCAILVKAFYLQVIEHSFWVARANACLDAKFTVHSYRGTIYDRRGRVLAYSVPQRSLYAFGSQIKNPAKTAAVLARILREPAGFIEKKLTSSSRFVWIKRKITDQEAMEVEKLKIAGLDLTTEYKRFYPYRQVAGQVLGFVNIDGVGLEGVEKSCDKVLRSKPISVCEMRDGGRNPLWLNSTAPPEPTEGCGIRLALDAFIEYVAESELKKAALKYSARQAEVVIMDARSREVLAMANWPFFDPNIISERKGVKEDPARNHAISDSFEPGSTFKVFLMSAALDRHLVRPHELVYCENGRCKLAGHFIKDVHPHGWLTMQQVVKYSSNIGAAKIALHLGKGLYSYYIHRFGFGSLTGIDLPGECKGLVRPQKWWKPIDLAETGFGQSIGVTDIQLANATAVIACGGEWGRPLIVDNILDSQGKPIRKFIRAATRRVIRRRTADEVRAMMEAVTREGGTGVEATPAGYTAAGKTGTAQVMDRTTKRYSSTNYTAVFTGFVPAERPKLVITVVVHDPHGSIYGGVVAAPVFRNIAARVLPYLGVMPSEPNFEPGHEIRMANGSSARLKHASEIKKAAAGKRITRLVRKTARKRRAAIKTSKVKPFLANQIRTAPDAGFSRAPGKYSLEMDRRKAGIY